MVNKVILVGRLGSDPETFTFENGGVKTSFSLATTHSYKNKEGEWTDQTDWHNIVIARESKYHKGDLISVEGRIKYRDYTDKDGNKKYITEIIAQSTRMLSKASTPEQTPASNVPARQETETERVFKGRAYQDVPVERSEEPEDDLPF